MQVRAPSLIAVTTNSRLSRALQPFCRGYQVTTAAKPRDHGFADAYSARRRHLQRHSSLADSQGLLR